MNNEVLQTDSLCPACMKRIAAAYVISGDDVFLRKTCPEHGEFSALVWEGAEGFKAWQREHANQPPANPAQLAQRGCPFDCGLCTAHKQATCCVLFEVTQRCNMACPVCFASAGEQGAADPSLQRVGEWYDMLLSHGGPFNIQLSGGEPTLRDDLPDIIRMGRDRGFTFFQLNTNGLRLADQPGYPQALADAGLNTVFLQFDGLSAKSCIELRGEDVLQRKMAAIDLCAEAGLGVVLVPTVKRGVNDGELGALVDFAARKMPAVRGVHFQPMSYFGRHGAAPAEREHLTIPGLLAALEQQTGGRVKAADFLPGGAEHALCSFHADYTILDGEWKPQNRPDTGCCCGQSDDGGDAEAGNGDSRCGDADSGEARSSDAARENVARKWSAPGCCDTGPELPGYDLSALDEFLYNRSNRTLALSGMCFQDAWTLDLERLANCYINIVDDSRNCLVPFCSYNLTDARGNGLYRGREHG